MKIVYCILLYLIGSFSIQAAEVADHSARMLADGSDSRQLVDYPPAVRRHALANMRAHLQALAEIMDAFANAKYAEAAEIADKRLGMDSPNATGCRMDGAKMMSMMESSPLDQQMSLLMPEKMRELGQNMHKAANEFAAKARAADKNDKNVAEAALLLAKIPKQCVACHDGYRMK